MKRKWKDFDFTLMLVPLLLTAFGTVMIYSASMVVAVVKYEVPSNYFFARQAMWAFIGLGVFLFTSFFAYRHYQKLIKLVIGVVIALLIAVLIIGTKNNGARSWLEFGSMLSLQPAELAKIGIIMYLAAVYSKKQEYITDFGKAVLPPIILTGFILGLILLQPDIGTAAIVFLIACSVIFSAGIKVRHLSLLIGAGVILVVLAGMKMINGERIARFTGAYQPFTVPESDGYHLIQSYLAIGTGGLTGEGLGQSVQKLGYLPEPHTDFIAAVIAEELGVLGAGAVIGMLAVIVLRGIYISRRCEDSFGSLMALGISSMIGIQAFINLGAITGLLPITGVPLPFVSYGGSSLVIMLASVGILNNIARHVRAKEQHVSRETVPADRSSVEKVSYEGRSSLK